MVEKIIRKVAWMELRDRRVLFARSKGNNIFYTVGGKVEKDETDAAALVREVREEANVNLMPQTIIYLTTVEASADGQPKGTVVQIVCYKAKGAGELRPSSEIEEFVWLRSTDAEKTTPAGILVLEWLKSKNLID